jgi:hypothetical protein
MGADAGVVDEVVETLALPGAREHTGHTFGESAEALAVAHVELQRDGAPPQRFDLAHHGVCLGLVALVGEDHVDALFGELQRGVAAEAAARAGDEGDAGVGCGHVGLLEVDSVAMGRL